MHFFCYIQLFTMWLTSGGQITTLLLKTEIYDESPSRLKYDYN